MKTMKPFGSVLGLAAVLALGACSDMNTSNNMSGSAAGYPPSVNSGGVYSGYGVVQSVELVRQGSSVGLGTIAGAVVGGIVGNQVGGGAGNTAATVIGAAGGAYAGHELEKRNQQPSDAYRLTIRMNDGSYQTLMQSSNADIRVGDRVRIDNGVALRY